MHVWVFEVFKKLTSACLSKFHEKPPKSQNLKYSCVSCTDIPLIFQVGYLLPVSFLLCFLSYQLRSRAPRKNYPCSFASPRSHPCKQLTKFRAHKYTVYDTTSDLYYEGPENYMILYSYSTGYINYEKSKQGLKCHAEIKGFLWHKNILTTVGQTLVQPGF